MRQRAIGLLVSPWLIAFALAPSTASPQDGAYIRQHYTKYEHRIEMRDGVKLFTVVYVPKDRSKQYPILLMRTPYSVRPYGVDAYLGDAGNQRARYFRDGYVMAYQDVRGRYMSEGEFVNVRPYIPDKKSPKDIDETTDTYDTVDWLVKNVPANNGKVGISGISYPGFYSSMGAIDAHPAVKAVSPQAPVSQWMGGDDWFHNGAFLLSHAFNFYVKFGWPRPQPKSEPDPGFDYPTPDGYEFFLQLGVLSNADAEYMNGKVAFWNQLMSHGTWDSFWAARDILPHLRNIKPAMLVVGGWFDAENLYGALHTYQSIEKNNPGATNSLVMGPWSHGEWARTDGEELGAIDFGSRTADYYTEHVELPFFNHYLKGEGELDLAEATVFDTGADQWRRYPSWPPPGGESRKLYLHENGGLSFEPPRDGEAEDDEYVSDPDKPVPYTGQIAQWYNRAYMLEDQRFASRRPDVLVYETVPLDRDVTVAGPIDVSFTLSTSGTDSDWVVKLVDVLPEDTPDPAPNPDNVRLGGYQMLVRGDVLRGKFREDLARPKPFVPNEATPVSFTLQDVLHTFKRGHRIMVQVQSSWFPLVDRNPQTFVDIYHAKPADYREATERVFHSRSRPSFLEVEVLNP